MQRLLQSRSGDDTSRCAGLLSDIAHSPFRRDRTGHPDPARTSATIEYTPASGDDLEDSFTFAVQDPSGAVGVAVVRINPGADSPPPDAPPVSP